jgi:hypothetical protein
MEIAEIRHVRDVEPDPAPLRRPGHVFVHRASSGRYEDQPASFDVAFDESPTMEDNGARFRQMEYRLDRVRRNDGHLCAFG